MFRLLRSRLATSAFNLLELRRSGTAAPFKNARFRGGDHRARNSPSDAASDSRRQIASRRRRPPETRESRAPNRSSSRLLHADMRLRCRRAGFCGCPVRPSREDAAAFAATECGLRGKRAQLRGGSGTVGPRPCGYCSVPAAATWSRRRVEQSTNIPNDPLMHQRDEFPLHVDDQQAGIGGRHQIRAAGAALAGVGAFMSGSIPNRRRLPPAATMPTPATGFRWSCVDHIKNLIIIFHWTHRRKTALLFVGPRSGPALKFCCVDYRNINKENSNGNY